MNNLENAEFGIVNNGDQAELVPVILKDHSKDPVIVPEVKVEAPVIEKKKRGRPKKVVTEEVKPLKEWYCSTCRENISDKNVMRIGAGDNGRCAVFCPQCTRSFGFEDQELHDRVAKLVRDNPTGK